LSSIRAGTLTDIEKVKVEEINGASAARLRLRARTGAAIHRIANPMNPADDTTAANDSVLEADYEHEEWPAAIDY
jgi:hypothetical protein